MISVGSLVRMKTFAQPGQFETALVLKSYRCADIDCCAHAGPDQWTGFAFTGGQVVDLLWENGYRDAAYHIGNLSTDLYRVISPT